MVSKRNQNASNCDRVSLRQNKTLSSLKKFIVLNKNVLFRSKILFQKRINSIFFGTKAAERKLPILKERWFDIANQYRTVKSPNFVTLLV
jgi:hypothetical protein